MTQINPENPENLLILFVSSVFELRETLKVIEGGFK